MLCTLIRGYFTLWHTNLSTSETRFNEAIICQCWNKPWKEEIIDPGSFVDLSKCYNYCTVLIFVSIICWNTDEIRNYYFKCPLFHEFDITAYPWYMSHTHFTFALLLFTLQGLCLSVLLPPNGLRLLACMQSLCQFVLVNENRDVVMWCTQTAV